MIHGQDILQTCQFTGMDDSQRDILQTSGTIHGQNEVTTEPLASSWANIVKSQQQIVYYDFYIFTYLMRLYWQRGFVPIYDQGFFYYRIFSQ